MLILQTNMEKEDGNIYSPGATPEVQPNTESELWEQGRQLDDATKEEVRYLHILKSQCYVCTFLVSLPILQLRTVDTEIKVLSVENPKLKCSLRKTFFLSKFYFSILFTFFFSRTTP